VPELKSDAHAVITRILKEVPPMPTVDDDFMARHFPFPPEYPVLVRRQWNSHLIAEVPFAAISGLHWSSMSGGVHARAPRDFLHGYISCAAIIDGALAHSCRHGEGPHHIKVCIVKKDNKRVAFAALVVQCRKKLVV
jgi:hypothetical protein